ncbi:MAG: hydroxyacid dehydrogenase [Bacteroidetes bacterium]|nr:MAG: hydroxyacid dehydrogenase [Bacteroidota bacterium]
MSIKIVVTSRSFSLNKTLRIELLQHFPENVVFNDKGLYLDGQALLDFVQGADILVVGLEKIDENVLKVCPNLKMISKYGVGLDNIDLEICQKYGVKIGWTGGVNRLSVAEVALGFMLGLCRNLFLTSLQHKSGIWNKSGGYQLSGKTVGIIGVGFIGKELVRLLKPFGCKILVNDIIDQKQYYSENNLTETSKEDIFRQADLISFHTPLNTETTHLVRKETLELMKPSAFLINTARGSIIKREDLKWALQNKMIKGAAIDVYEEEPPTDLEFLQLENLVCTPHLCGNSEEAVLAMGRSAIRHLV